MSEMFIASAERDGMFMREALEEARVAASMGEVPVGCVIVNDGEIIARAHNLCRTHNDPTAHAEMLAIREAARDAHRLEGCALYVTLEPCPMCAGAISQARLERAVYGASDPAMGCAGSVYSIPEDPAFGHFCRCDGGVLADECAKLLDEFFKNIRNK